MKTFFLTISLIIMLSIVYLIASNTTGIIELNYAMTGIKTLGKINLSLYTLSILCSGLFVGAGIVYLFLSAQKEQNKAFQRELERRSISGEENASKVEVLEAKIKTLEKAFNTVIDERTKLEIQINALNDELERINKQK